KRPSGPRGGGRCRAWAEGPRGQDGPRGDLGETRAKRAGRGAERDALVPIRAEPPEVPQVARSRRRPLRDSPDEEPSPARLDNDAQPPALVDRGMIGDHKLTQQRPAPPRRAGLVWGGDALEVVPIGLRPCSPPGGPLS